jgi:D-xylose transport system permease protein
MSKPDAATIDLPHDLADERLIQREGLSGLAAGIVARIRSGDLGSLPVVLGLIVICIIFQAYNSVFLSSANLSNLVTESASIGVVAIGIVLVLLVGQIDLSVGSMSGLAAAIVGIGMTKHGWPVGIAIGAAVLAGVGVGLVYGFIFVRFSVASFVITLSGLLALLGLQLKLLGPNGTVNLSFESWLVEFMQQMYVPAELSYVLGAAVVAVFALSRLARRRRRRSAGLSTGNPAWILGVAGVMLAAVEVSCWYLNRDRGISWPFVLFVGLVVITHLMLTRTRWGRAVYAVGGSAEAARRAGIRVNRIYFSVFVLCSSLAALGGVLAAGRLAAASTASGTGDVNLNAIAAAVIGGTSLYGGRGNAFSALLGTIVIAAIASGLNLLSLDAATRFIITGGVLMVAVIADSVTQRSRAAHGNA